MTPVSPRINILSFCNCSGEVQSAACPSRPGAIQRESGGYIADAVSHLPGGPRLRTGQRRPLPIELKRGV